MSRYLSALVGIFFLTLLPSSALSQDNHNERVASANQGTVSIISGGIGGTYIRIATDLAAVLDDGENLRILPIAADCYVDLNNNTATDNSMRLKADTPEYFGVEQFKQISLYDGSS